MKRITIQVGVIFTRVKKMRVNEGATIQEIMNKLSLSMANYPGIYLNKQKSSPNKILIENSDEDDGFIPVRGGTR